VLYVCFLTLSILRSLKYLSANVCDTGSEAKDTFLFGGVTLVTDNDAKTAYLPFGSGFSARD
jgi:hypothetical protein